MFRIGEFSTFSRVSVKMLRHYDDLGLLKPAKVDSFTNYRYYSAHQLPRLNRILALKDLGFSLEQIKTMLDEDLSTEQLRGMLKLRRAEIEAQLWAEEARLAQVESRLIQLEQTEQAVAYDVVLRHVEAHMVASIRQIMGEAEPTVTQLFEELEAYVATYNARASRPPLLLMHDAEFQESAQDVEVVIPIKAPVPANGRIQIQELTGYEQMACLIHTGNYDNLPNAYGLLLSWIENHNYQIIGPIREAYLRFGADLEGYDLPDGYLANSASDFVTELQIPIERVQ